MHGDHIQTVMKAFRQFLHAHGYISMAIDGTKMKANAKREMLTVEKIEKRLHHLDDQLEEYLSKLAENDIRDDLAEEVDTLDRSIAVDRHLLDKIIALQKQVEELTAHKPTVENSGKPSLSPSDPDVSLMKSRDGKVPAYNVQTVVDDAYHMIATTEVLTDPDDHAALTVMVTSLKEELGVVPKELIADNGYYTPDLIEEVETATRATCYVPPPQKDDDASTITFQYDASTDRYACSAGKPLVLHHVYRGTQCTGCQLRAQCTTSKHRRMVHRYHNQDWRDTYLQRMKHNASTAIVKVRKALVEHPFGTIKLWGGKLPLSLRGAAKVATEINLYATAYNLRRLLNCTLWDTMKEQVASYSWKLV